MVNQVRVLEKGVHARDDVEIAGLPIRHLAGSHSIWFPFFALQSWQRVWRLFKSEVPPFEMGMM